VQRFQKRHKNSFVLQWATRIDTARHRADSAFKYLLYFKLLEEKIEKYKVQPCHIYNIDEKGFLIRILSKQKRIFSKRRFQEGGIKQMLQDRNRE
jgi:hypothetical protein